MRALFLSLLIVAGTAEAQSTPAATPATPTTPAASPAPTTPAATAAPANAELMPAFGVAEGGTLRIEVPAGRLQLRPSTDDQVHVAGRVQPGQRLRVITRGADQLLQLDDRERLRPAEADLQLQVPVGLPLHVRAERVDVDLDGVGGAQLRVEGGSGSLFIRSDAPTLRISSLRGPVQVESGGGDIAIDTLNGSVNVAVAAAAPTLAVQTLAGDVALTAAQPGRTRVASVAGNLLLQLGQGSAPLEAETVGGNIVVVVPETVNAGLSVAMGRGLPVLPEGRAASADGVVAWGAGDWPLRLRTLSGGLTVREGPLPPPRAERGAAAK